MAFNRKDPVTRNPHIRKLEVSLYRSVMPEDHEYPEGAVFRLVIDDQLDLPMDVYSGDLTPHLTPAQITALQGFMDALWAKAEAEVIG